MSESAVLDARSTETDCATLLVPGPDNQRDYRNALGRFATGVAVVTCHGDGVPIGMTINSFSSVSLEPPLILWSLAKTAHRFEPLFNAHRFSVHVLLEHQRKLALDFARHPDAFSQTDWRVGPNNVPLLDDVLARFDCEQTVCHDAGDHVIIVGRVAGALVGHGAPLVFSGGAFGGFKED